MKKFINPLPAGLMPVYKSDLVQIQDNAFDALTSILKGLRATTNFIISGMDVTSAGAGLINISAGYWFRISTGEVYKFAGISSAAYPLTVAQGGVTVGTKVYKDGSTQNVTQDLLTQVQQSTVITGSDAIVFNSDTTRRYYNMFSKKISDLLTTPWTAVPGGNGKLKYSKNAFGDVSLCGYIGTSGDLVGLILPIGFRPSSTQTFYTSWFDFGAPPEQGSVSTVIIATTGLITATAINGAGTDRNQSVNVSFPTTVTF